MGFLKAAGSTAKREVKEYAIDNLLVVGIVVAMLVLRARDLRRPAGQRPMLVRALEILPDGFAPLPMAIMRAISTDGR